MHTIESTQITARRLVVRARPFFFVVGSVVALASLLGCSSSAEPEVREDEAALAAPAPPLPAPPQCAVPQSINPCWGLRLGDVCGNAQSQNKLVCQSVKPNEAPGPIKLPNGTVICNVCAVPPAPAPGGPIPNPGPALDERSAEELP